MRSRSINSDTGEDGQGAEPNPDSCFSNTLSNQHSKNCEVLSSERKLTGDSFQPVTSPPNADTKRKTETVPNGGMNRRREAEEEDDKLFIHLKDNMETVREFCKNMVRQIPVPEHCMIEGNVKKTACFSFETGYIKTRGLCQETAENY